MFNVSIDKCASKFEIDFDALPPQSRERVIVYGLTQLLSDAAAPVATSANVDGRRIPLTGKDLASAHMAARKLVEQRLDDLRNGVMRRARESSVNSVDAEAKRIAIGLVRVSPVFKSWLAKNNLKATDKSAVSKLSELAQSLSVRKDIVAMATKRVEESSSIAVDISL